MCEISSSRLALYKELDSRVLSITERDYIAPQIKGIPKGFELLGPATDSMKKLWTLWKPLDTVPLSEKKAALRRGVESAFAFEVAEHFGGWWASVGVNSDWQVYAIKHPAS